MSELSDTELKKLFLNKTPLIDVRAPVEFLGGSLPFSVNLPIMNDEERAMVGTCYKAHGQEAAIKLGHELVTGQLKEERISQWMKFIKEHPEAKLFCFRGGLRSQTACQWLREKGIEIYPLAGGYKWMRTFFLNQLETGSLPVFYRLGGLTGSRKTHFLSNFQGHIDLEKLANHRGSAFGGVGTQPSQVKFENELALELMKFEGKKILVEDESPTIGKIVLPNRFLLSLRSSPLVIINVGMDLRVTNIFEDYVKGTTRDFFLNGVTRIQKRLSNSLKHELIDSINKAYDSGMTVENHSHWISLLLENYYDPLYQKDLNYQMSHIIFEGNPKEVLDFLKDTGVNS